MEPGQPLQPGPPPPPPEERLTALLGAITPDELELRFQPILLVTAPGQFALEVLLRFRPPELAALGTEAVFRRAHGLGIAHQLDALVLERLQGVQQNLRQLGALAGRINYVAVNISGASVATAPRLEALMALLRGHRVDPELFRLEITETAAMELLEGDGSLVSSCQRLMDELNFRLLIDDFGSGLSNYRRLCEVWYDTIKLDLQLVSGIARSFRLQGFVGSLIDAVHGLGRTVVAEGVETHGDLEVLLRLGADAVQGFLISRPLAWEQLEPFLRESSWADPGCIPALHQRIRESDQALLAPAPNPVIPGPGRQPVPMERYILEHWTSLRSFEEFVLLFVQELRGWGLQMLRLSLAFLPDRQEVDCSQYVWNGDRPGDVQALRMQRDFLETQQHRESVLHHIATRCPLYRVRLAEGGDTGFAFIEELRQRGGSDYLGLRLHGRGISIPVLTVCLRGSSVFSAEQLERLQTMSNLLSLLFHAFESERASRLALLDPLTELPNRRSFDSCIRAELVAAATARTPLALLLIDIDRFKLVNDTFGHATGDTCLSEVAALLRRQLQRKADMVARLGGEEFGVILPHTEPAAARAIAEGMREAVAAAAIRHPDPINARGLTISLGLASWQPQPGQSPDFDQLLQLADDCLYAAKDQGRDRVVAATLGAGQDGADRAARVR